MKIYHLNRVQFMPIAMQTAWDFFSSPANLSQITPPEMGLHMKSKLTGESIRTGMTIEYVVRPVFKIPIRWTSEITWVMAPATFIDKQTRGPYALWEHTHTFTEVPGGVRMSDEVLYAMPMGIIGRLVHAFIVKRKLNYLFSFRERTLEAKFGKLQKK